MAILHDYHLHTVFSGDCNTPVKSLIDAAITKGLEGICLTDHLDIDYPVCDACPAGFFLLNIPIYRDYFLNISQNYTNKINVYWGIELGMQPHLAQQHDRIINNHPFDFVLGSIHACHGQNPYFPDYFYNREEEAAYREYFTCVLENLNAYQNFDSLAHMDYIVRYGPNKDAFYSYEQYQDLLDAILIKLVSMGKAIECNTGAIRYGLKSLNPTKDILTRYLKLGGEYVTIGSDSHNTSDIANGFSITRDYLLACGFTHYTTFQNREPVMHKL